ncbi:acetolactate decarboxylase [Vibrio alginolyticus]|uniref:acetolactate decarboxylase n=1 Tax=Vibrio alginolyticus TaxID=663 RepID=UPI0015F68382|nr:acetolactate decarboxylase [Vibrio alginolyticus]MCR9312769.1 acetolactate decarboxylase [Vibrio alginolyticus]MCR9319174.1 acetolactate decarboxylase [Vibrio alginolyticus]MCR9401787.1 acetolactate decarboxylase [Vibrio alginolyticus]MCR9465668.1 acetolactate decarboxylase [Vibrio alginolyticus]MCR9480988.1 acetolactate decarboxylase [Vibrio alginolyticus]
MRGFYNPLCACSLEVAKEFSEYHHVTGDGEIYQTSLMSALIAGVYEGSTTIEELLKHGDFGLGTFNELDGELIAFDKEVFQLKSDGSANPADLAQKTPFAVMTFFKPDIELPLTSRMSRHEVHSLIDDMVPSDNLFCAVRIDGVFDSVRTRTVPKQTRPYRPMLEVVKEQPTFRFTHKQGVVAGFRSPKYTTGINVPGYHEHFITDDRQGGGHIQDYSISSGFLQIGKVSRLVIDTPVSTDFLSANLAPEDIITAIEKAEK